MTRRFLNRDHRKDPGADAVARLRGAAALTEADADVGAAEALASVRHNRPSFPQS